VEDLIPSKYNLGQNYPNPFKNKTIIKYCIPDRVKIKLEILDSDKHTIKTIIDDIEEPGTYEVDLDASGLPSGVYFYQLRAGSPSTGSGQHFVEARKMVLIK
jgi:hypothetical protein